MKTRNRERGAVLVICLVFLALITLFVVCTVNMSTADLRVVGNVQNRMTMVQNAQQAIEQLISSIATFDAPAAQNVNVNGTPVAVATPVCLGTSPAPGYTAVANVTLYDTRWSITATASDPSSGATATLNQGVRIRLPTNFCP
jgi:Tfp pilus assembly protein PilX